MAFSKTFPRTVPGSNYPIWEEISLTEEEERAVEELCKKENFYLLDAAVQEAKTIAIKHGLNDDRNIVELAVALFEKQASHIVFHKENKAKEKFDKKYS